MTGQILIFGDSIACGYWDLKGGWVQKLKEKIDKKSLSAPKDFYYNLYNLSIDGNTTAEILKRFEFETKQRLINKETIFIFAIGTNDSDFVYSKNDFWVQPEKTKENIEKFIEIAQKLSSKIIFVGLTPVEEIKVNPMPWDTDKSSKNENIQRYNQIIKQVCEENKIYFIEIFENWIKTDYKKLLEDGVHPNSEGHQKIFETVRDFLKEKKII
jgi:lysophospholipase L1-like esterase